MTHPTIEPLHPQLWLERLAKLHSDAMGADIKPAESLIRQAFHLTKLAPGPYRDLLPVDVEEPNVEDMLGCGAYESAMMALVKPETAITIDKPYGARRYSAVVVIDPQTAPGKSSHEMCGKAVLCAWVSSLWHIAGVDLTYRGRRKSRSGSPPSSSAH